MTMMIFCSENDKIHSPASVNDMASNTWKSRLIKEDARSTWIIFDRFVSALSCTWTRNIRTRSHRTHDVTTPFNTHDWLPLCHRVTLDCGTLMGPDRTPTVHRCPKGETVGGPQQLPRHDDRQTTPRQRQDLATNMLSGNKCWQTLVHSHGCGADSRSRRSTKMSSKGRTRLCRTTTSSQHDQKLRIPESSMWQRENKRTCHPGEDNPGDRAHQDSRRIRTQIVVDVTHR